MTDQQFLAELRIRAYIDQIKALPVGDHRRYDLKPTTWKIPEKSYRTIVDRTKTLMLPCYAGFTEEEREILLKED